MNYGEFELTDKLQSADFIEQRAQTLRDLYGAHPEATRKLVSMLYPHPASRMWEHDELKDRLKKVAAEYLVSSMFPNLSAAFSAYQASRADEDAREYAANAAKFPALHASQPEMLAMQQQMMSGGGMPSAAPVVHHRRHRHHAM